MYLVGIYKSERLEDEQTRQEINHLRGGRARSTLLRIVARCRHRPDVSVGADHEHTPHASQHDAQLATRINGSLPADVRCRGILYTRNI